MAEDTKVMPFDLYSDAFTISITPFGANLTFGLREAHPSQTAPPQLHQIGTIRMSTEHLKTMVWICRKQIRQVEGQMGVSAEVPQALLSQLGVPPNEWADFWKPISGI